MIKNPISPPANITLDVQDLTLKANETMLVDHIGFKIEAGQTVALVGESGSGKSLTALAIMRLLGGSGVEMAAGQIKFADQTLYPGSSAAVRHLRGNRMAMIFQEPMTSLNPLHRVGKQIAEAISIHNKLPAAKIKQRVIALMEQVGIDHPQDRYLSYPHQLSGGQRQRIMIAMALANKPDLLIADEPTTALDVTTQAQILDLLADLKRQMNLSMLFITHDLKLVRKLADHVLVMQQGKLIEAQSCADFFAKPIHAYSKELLNSTPPPRHSPAPLDQGTMQHSPPMVETQHLSLSYVLKRALFGKPLTSIKALDDIHISIKRGHTLGVVGESGSGKTSLSLAILKLIQAEGNILFDGQNITNLGGKSLRNLRKDMQQIFQDPYGSLSPRMTIAQIILEGLVLHQPHLSPQAQSDCVSEILQEVGLDPNMQYRYPHEFSGGQRQRIAIARGLVLRPKFMILDEPTSAMDVKTQLKLIRLLLDIQQKHDLTYMIVSHDIAVIRAMADDIMVMQHGKCVEIGAAQQILTQPRHAYTKTLIAAANL
ncbi:MAG: ABC transporter ATP-binding protein [Alphaproteobacteria bacterium]